MSLLLLTLNIFHTLLWLFHCWPFFWCLWQNLSIINFLYIKISKILNVFWFQAFAFLILLLSLRSPIYDSLPIISTLWKNEQIYCLKTAESPQTWQISITLYSLFCGRRKCMFPFSFFKVWSIKCLNANEILNFVKIYKVILR